MSVTEPLTIKSVKVLGAGSIGNHMSHAARSLGWAVDLCDISEAALERAKTSIYPSRYGAWDDAIKLHTVDLAPRGGHDLIIVGTPPDHHIDLALQALLEGPAALLIEKPLCGPLLEGAQALYEAAKASRTRVFVGYDHVVGEAAERAAQIAASGRLGPIETMDVEFREHWSGIFAAHPWLSGPSDSYLGYWKRGGGASGEHSHAANLWQSFARAIGAGAVTRVSATMDYVSDGTCEYDKLCLMTFETENGMTGRVVQDVVTRPPRKWARIQGRDGFVEWHCGYKPGCDAVITGNGTTQDEPHLVPKTRPDDFIRELKHIQASIRGDAPSPISLESGLDTIQVIAAAHHSARHGCKVSIDRNAGYRLSALSAANR
jgi:predicted dehydrogenase